jgi:hypothetical protein
MGSERKAPVTDIRVPTQCSGCGQIDDHPKFHFGPGPLQFHFDCIPYFIVEDATHVSDWVWDGEAKAFALHRRDPIPEDALHPMVKHTLRVREQAQKGVHGADLVAKIADLWDKHKPHQDEAGASANLEAVQLLTDTQAALRPVHLQPPVTEGSEA